MRLIKAILVFSLLLSGFASSALAAEESGDPVLICRELIQSIKQQQDALTQGNSRDLARGAQMLQSIQRQIESDLLPKIEKEDWNGAALALSEFSGMSITGEIGEGISKLTLSVQAKQQAQQERLVAELNALQKTLSENLLTYGQPSELDTPIKALNQMNGQFASPRNWGQNERSDIQSLLNLLVAWQDFLHFRNQGNSKEALQRLNTIKDQVGRLPIVPRSKVLELEAGLKGEVGDNQIDAELSEILALLNGAESYEKTFRRLQDLFDRSNRNYRVSLYRDMLESFLLAQRSIDEGNPYALFYHINARSYAATTEVDARMGGERDRLVLAGLAIGQTEALLPQQGEPVAVYVDRVATALGEQGNWQEQWEFLDRVRASRALENNSGLYDELNRSTKLIAGSRYEQIGDNETAYQFYSEVLASPSRFQQGRGAQDGIQRLISQDAGVARRARIKQTELKAYREYIFESLSRDRGGMPAHMLSEQALKTMIDKGIKESVAVEVGKMAGGGNPFVESGDRTQGKPAAKADPGKRFAVTYLDDNDSQITQVFDVFVQGGDGPLRTLGSNRLMVEDIDSIQIENPLALDVIKRWPSKFENRRDIPRTQLKITLLSGEVIEDEMHSTLRLTFFSETENSRLSQHPSRILSIKRVP